MSLPAVLARIDAINHAFVPPAPPPAPTTTTAGTSFASNLKQAMAPTGTPAAGPAALAPVTGAPAQRMVQIAKAEVGQAEQPPGSNDSPRIAQYRSAVAGSPGPGPWCAYFASWVAKQAGVPLGPNGSGFGSVDQLWAWAQQNGRAVPRGGQPQPGDLIILHEHVGVVTGVLPGGQLQTVEGNYSDKVSQNVRSVGEAIGFVRPA